jgi:hypothetical protein
MSDGWTNREVQADPQRYLAWQEEQRTKAERERKAREEESDFERFSELFVQRGGERSKAREMYDRYRNDMALEAAKKHDRASNERMRSERSRSV